MTERTVIAQWAVRVGKNSMAHGPIFDTTVVADLRHANVMAECYRDINPDKTIIIEVFNVR